MVAIRYTSFQVQGGWATVNEVCHIVKCSYQVPLSFYGGGVGIRTKAITRIIILYIYMDVNIPSISTLCVIYMIHTEIQVHELLVVTQFSMW